MQVRLCCGMALDALTACGTGMQGRRQVRILGSVKTIISKVRAEPRMRTRLLPCIPVPQAVNASKAIPQQSLTCIPIMSRSLSYCLPRYKGMVRSESELEQNAVERNEVFSIQLIPQLLKTRGLLGRKRFTVKVVSIHYPDPTAVAAPHSLNRI